MKARHPSVLVRTTRPARPLVSAIIPTYCRPYMVRQAVETVLAQDYSEIEVIVVDDNTDPQEQQAVRAALAEFGDRVTVIPNGRSKGACGARNTGVLHAKGKYIAFLDDDDLWMPGKIRAQVSMLERTDFVATFCGYIDVYLAFYHARRCRASRPVLKREHALAGECPTSTSLVVIRRNVLIEAGLFDETLQSFQDFDMWLRCLEFGDLGYVDEALVTFIQHAGDRTSINLSKRLAGLRSIERKWGDEMRTYTNFSAFKRRIIVDALIANGKSMIGAGYFASLLFFLRAVFVDRCSLRSAFWLTIGVLGSRRGSALYKRLLLVRKSIETVSVAT